MRLLLAEDDDALREVLERGLREYGYVVDAVTNGDDALHMLEVCDYAIAILDWRMPGLVGVEVVRRVRRRREPVAVMLLTARDSASDRVEGLDAGADDYLVKPFDFGELLARLRALQRRPRVTEAPRMLLGRLELSPADRHASRDGVALSLTLTEYTILELLMRRSPNIVPREAIANHAWEDDSDAVGSNTIDVHVARLRRKLDGAEVRIQAVRNIGYRLLAC